MNNNFHAFNPDVPLDTAAERIIYEARQPIGSSIQPPAYTAAAAPEQEGAEIDLDALFPPAAKRDSFPPAVERAAVRYFEARLDEINRRAAGGPEWGFTAEAREAARVIGRRWGTLMGQTKRARILASYDWLDELRARQNAYDAAQAAAGVK